MRLRNGPLAGLAVAAPRVHITVPNIVAPSPASGLAVQSVMASLRQAFPHRA
jgi:hypothetical protein